MMESQTRWAHFTPMGPEWGQRGWEFKLPLIHSPLGSGQLCGKEGLPPVLVFDPVLGSIRASHTPSGGVQARVLEPGK
jgi:hypothetical protein